MNNENEYSFLIEETSENKRQIFLRPGDKFVFGRGEDCDYIIDNRQVSRIHATLKCKRDEIIIVIDGDGDNISRNGIYNSSGEKIKIQANLNPGDFVWVFLIPDYYVKLTFLEDIDRDTLNGFSYEERMTRSVADLKQSISKLSEKLENHIANQRVSNRQLIKDEIKILDAEKGFSEKISQIVEEQKNVRKDIDEARITNKRQDKAIKILYPIVLATLLLFGLSGTLTEMSKDERKDWIEFTRDISIAIMGGYGLIKIKESKK